MPRLGLGHQQVARAVRGRGPVALELVVVRLQAAARLELDHRPVIDGTVVGGTPLDAQQVVAGVRTGRQVAKVWEDWMKI